MNKKVTIITSISFTGILVLLALIYFSVSWYRTYKYKSIVKSTTDALVLTKGNIHLADLTINQTSSILVLSEKEKLFHELSLIRDNTSLVEKDISEYTQLKDSQLVRAKLEEGFDDEARKAGYKTPIKCLEELNTKLQSIDNFCKNRTEIRNRAVKNEMKLKSILKKPYSGIEIPHDLRNVSKHASEFLKMIPEDNERTKTALAKIPEVNLRNSMGVLLFNAITDLDDIKEIAKADDIRIKAETMWNDAKECYLNVKPANDLITWYVPEKDDGNYDTSAYVKLLSQQASALSFYENGNRILSLLSNYRKEVRDQKLVYVSSNSYEDTTFRHSKRVERTGIKTNSKGELVNYTYYETKYYNTPGRIFYYTVTTITPTSRSDNKIKDGSRDSYSLGNSFGAWKNWDYDNDKTEGYLIQYKPFGYDNRSILQGGIFNPHKHVIVTNSFK